MSASTLLSKTPTANRLFYINFARNPGPINITTLIPTQTFVDPRSVHPYRIRTQRKLQAFDASKLHWTVSVPVDVSKSAYIRNRVGRRVREAFRQELRRAGWESDGRVVPSGDGEGVKTPSFNLSGALKLGLVKDSFALTATIEEVRSNAAWAVRAVAALQKDGRKDSGSNSRGVPRNNKGKGTGAGKKAAPPGLNIHRARTKE